MTDRDAVAVERLPPEAAFGLLGNDTRIAIMRALWEADGPLSFSALRERTGVADSGQFNYHLGKLTGHFVRQTEEGYELGVAGFRVAGAVLSGSYTTTTSMDAIPVGADCRDCGGDLEATYDDEQFFVRCVDCEAVVSQGSFPPGPAQQYDREELPTAFEAGSARSTLAPSRGSVRTARDGSSRRHTPTATSATARASSSAVSAVERSSPRDSRRRCCSTLQSSRSTTNTASTCARRRSGTSPGLTRVGPR